MVEVTREDREAAAAAFYCKPLLDAKHNTDRRVQAFARHRIAERERCAGIAYQTCAETRHVTLGDKCAQAIREPKP